MFSVSFLTCGIENKFRFLFCVRYLLSFMIRIFTWEQKQESNEHVFFSPFKKKTVLFSNNRTKNKPENISINEKCPFKFFVLHSAFLTFHHLHFPNKFNTMMMMPMTLHDRLDHFLHQLQRHSPALLPSSSPKFINN